MSKNREIYFKLLRWDWLCWKIKQEKKEPTEKYRSLGDTNYNILKSLKVRDEVDDYVESELEKTMTNTRMLKKLNDNDLKYLLG